jgi:predicted transcriptional regulator
MDPTQRPPVSDAEREILRVLWDQGPRTAREVLEHLSAAGVDWQRSTVITLLQRLEKKGYVASDRTGHAFVFRAAVSREELMHQRLVELASELADGRPAGLLLAFAERHAFTAAELDELRRLVDELAAKHAKKKRQS